MDRKTLTLPCGVTIGGDSFVQIMTADVSGKNNSLYLEVEVMNLHSRALNAIDYEVIFYNSILEKLNIDPYKINQNDFNISNAQIGSTGKYQIPREFSNARKVDITLIRGYFDDGNALDLKYQNSEIVTIDNLEAKQKVALQENAGEDAVALAQSNELSWRCVCGYFNDIASEVCGNCERNKEEVLEKYSSLDGILKSEPEEIIKEGEVVEEDKKTKKEKVKREKIKKVKVKKEKVKKEKVKKDNPNKLLESISSKLSVLDKKSKFFLIGSFILLFASIILYIMF